jgi:hypothetical protein
MEFATTFKIVGIAEKLTVKLHSALKSAKGHKRKILLELQNNLDVLQLWKQKNFPIDSVISKLERKHYDYAVEENFNFNTIKIKSLKETTTKGVPQFQKYVGWSTEKLIDNMYRKIKILSDIIEIDTDNDKIKKSVRLINIYKIMFLIIHHINS